MATGLLFLIVLILLFGAGVVKGWLLNAIGAILGLCLVIGIILWICSIFSLGDGGFMVIFMVGGLLLALGAAWARGDLRRLQNSLSATDAGAANPMSRTLYVWRIYERQINGRFSPEAKAAAYAAMNRGDEHGLNSLCMEELARLRGGRG